MSNSTQSPELNKKKYRQTICGTCHIVSSDISYLLQSVGKQPIHSYFQRQTKLNCIVCPCFVIHRQTTILVKSSG